MEKDIGMQLSEFAVKTRYEDIPKEALEFSKWLTLKTVAGMLAGSNEPSGQKMAKIIKNQELPEEITVIGNRFKTSLWQAVFLNSYFAHVSELEDDRFAEGVSWDITVIPLLLSLAEKLGQTGRELMEAIAVGLEVHTRTCLFNAQHLGLFLIPGAVGPAVGGAKALKLEERETAAALGLAMSGVPLSSVNLGYDGHFFESALMSLQGIMAAEMAKVGLKGNSDIGNYLNNYLGEENVVQEKMVENLGEKWMFCEIQIKKYPCCIQLHRHIDMVIELKKENNFSFHDVKEIDVLSGPAYEFLNRPEPKTEGDLQFSFQHVLSAAMLDGDVGLKHISEDSVLNSEMIEARTKIKFIITPEYSSSNLTDILKAPARVVIKMKNGRELKNERLYPLGHPNDPMTIEQLKDLYSRLTQGILAKKNISRTTDLILNLEKLDSIKEIMGILTL